MPQLDTDPFDGELWVRAVDWYLDLDARRASSGNLSLEPYLLVFTALLSTMPNPSVLDFGGGCGNTYLPVASQLPACVKFSYVIVDSPANCARGRDRFAADARVSFYTRLEDAGDHFDLILASSTLQYLRDWRTVCHDLANLGAEHIVLTRLPCAEQGFIVKQNLTLAYGPDEGKQAGIAYHAFFDRQEIASVFADAGYECRLDLFYSDYTTVLSHIGKSASLRTMLFSVI